MMLATTLALLGCLAPALAHNIQLGAHKKECFHEQLHKDDKMTVTFQVGDREFGGAGNLDIDFWVCFAHASMVAVPLLARLLCWPLATPWTRKLYLTDLLCSPDR